MTRVFVGMVAVAVVGLAPGVVTAAGEGGPQFRAVRGNGYITVSVEADGLSVRQRISPNAFNLEVAQSGDVVRVTGGADGLVTVERGRQKHGFSMRDPQERDFALVRQMVAGSPVLHRFGELTASVRTRRDAAAQVLRHASTMVGLLQGNFGPLQETVSLVKQPTAGGLLPIAQRTRNDGGPYTAAGCWTAYERDVIRYTYELEGCLRDARSSWNPLASGWCAYEYDLKATLAFYWLLDCSGYPW